VCEGWGGGEGEEGRIERMTEGECRERGGSGGGRESG